MLTAQRQALVGSSWIRTALAAKGHQANIVPNFMQGDVLLEQNHVSSGKSRSVTDFGFI